MYQQLTRRVGRPRKFQTPDDLLSAVEEYLAHVDKNPFIVNDFRGKEEVLLKKQRPYSLTGFLLFCGLGSTWWFDAKEGYTKTDKEFSKVFTHVENIFMSQRVDGAVVGIFKENIIARELERISPLTLPPQTIIFVGGDKDSAKAIENLKNARE